MNKKIILTLSVLAIFATTYAYGRDVNQLQPIGGSVDAGTSQGQASSSVMPDALNPNKVYYPNATIKSATAKYKAGNYTGCLQELFSLVKKDPSNALAYYYMAMAYTHINMKDQAVAAYEQVIALNPNQYLVDYATKGRDCLTDGPACKPPEATAAPKEELSDLDKFIRAPYGNGLSPELNREVKQKQLTNIKETINQKENLEQPELQKIKNFDNNKSEVESGEKVAQVSDEEILQAIKTLKNAGLNLTVQSENQQNQYAQIAQMMQNQDPKMAELNMLLGNNNNNNNNSMMNMLPMLMSQAQQGKNVDPRLMQAMMMNSMMPDFSFNDDNKY